MTGLGAVITAVIRRRVAANALMLVFVLAGFWALGRIGTRFLPPFEVQSLSVVVQLEGASAAEIADAVTTPLENSLRAVPDIAKMTSYSRENIAFVTLEFASGTDIADALISAKSAVAKTVLPGQAKRPVVLRHTSTESIAKLIMTGGSRAELRKVAKRLYQDLGAAGVGKVHMSGLPKEQIRVLINRAKLYGLGTTVGSIGEMLRAQNLSVPVGSIEALGSERKVRADSETEDFNELLATPVFAGSSGELVLLGDIATVERGLAPDQTELYYMGRPAIGFEISSNPGGDMIGTAKKLGEWVAKTRARLPPSVKLTLYDEEWKAVDSRLRLLLKNGASGFALVLLVLFLFLSGRIALWVAVGIPVAMMAALFAFALAGGTFNMVSMFALIMALGLIVDDSIVVGENVQHRLERGAPPMRAIVSACRQMFPPVFASSLTTASSFVPVFIVGGTIGSIVFAIPLVIICILAASLAECFLILPGHLYQIHAHGMRYTASGFRRALDGAFAAFRERCFRPVALLAVRCKTATVAACLTLLALSAAAVVFGRVDYLFFPAAERSSVTAAVEFVPGTPRAQVEEFVRRMQDELGALERELGGGAPLIKHVVARVGTGGLWSAAADNRAAVRVELVEADRRAVTTREFAHKWQKNMLRTPGLAKLSMDAAHGGPDLMNIEILLTGGGIERLKAASLAVQEALRSTEGVIEVADDAPYGKEELVLALSPLGRALNLDLGVLVEQLKHAAEGFHVQTFTDSAGEVELRVRLADFGSEALENFLVLLPSGEHASLGEVAVLSSARDFAGIVHRNGRPAVSVSADFAPDAMLFPGDLMRSLHEGVFAELAAQHGIKAEFAGSQAEQRRTVSDMGVGLAVAVMLIYIILTWTFNSWTLPLVVMVTMPLGIIGTIFGHWIMGIPMSILSFLGMFTLMGIIVNDSIVLVRRFTEIRGGTTDAGRTEAAIVEAACQRLRAVLLTSLTTIGGLLPLLFETSRQAQFLIPMAVSICFGLGFATVLILLFTPACLSLHCAAVRLLGPAPAARQLRPA